MRKDIKVYKSRYDGFFSVLEEDGSVSQYEGKDLCPKNIQRLIEDGNYKVLDCFRSSVPFLFVK